MLTNSQNLVRFPHPWQAQALYKKIIVGKETMKNIPTFNCYVADEETDK